LRSSCCFHGANSTVLRFPLQEVMTRYHIYACHKQDSWNGR
jgi:hypothetical protein